MRLYPSGSGSGSGTGTGTGVPVSHGNFSLAHTLPYAKTFTSLRTHYPDPSSLSALAEASASAVVNATGVDAIGMNDTSILTTGVAAPADTFLPTVMDG